MYDKVQRAACAIHFVFAELWGYLTILQGLFRYDTGAAKLHIVRQCNVRELQFYHER